MSKTYHGCRTKDGCNVLVEENRRTCQLPPCNDLWNHSPTGFNWGYGGSGPAQLALALCISVLGDERWALAIYQDFKRHFVAGLEGHSWSVSEDTLRNIMRGLMTVHLLEKGNVRH